MSIKSKVLIISVSAGTGCYRHIKISNQATLEELSDEILEAFEFVNDHAHAFFMDNRAWSHMDSYFFAMEDEDCDDERYTYDYTLQEAGCKLNKKFLYIFDYGNEWRFACRVLKELDEPTDEPQVIRSKGEPPMQYPEFEDWDEDDEEF
jgi:hypothetical protein